MSLVVDCDGGPGEHVHSLDEMLEVLSNYQRRAIIRFLRDASGNVHPIEDVIDHLRTLEKMRHGETPGEDHLLSVLVHVHGPKLDDAGLIEYDVPGRVIRYYPNEQYDRILELIESTADEFDDA